jgi:hypothetical protein
MNSLWEFVVLVGGATDQVLGYLERHHWFLASWWSVTYFTYATRAFMPDLTRSINGWMKSESVLPAAADHPRRTG